MAQHGGLTSSAAHKPQTFKQTLPKIGFVFFFLCSLEIFIDYLSSESIPRT
jgi:hypothetical protein